MIHSSSQSEKFNLQPQFSSSKVNIFESDNSHQFSLYFASNQDFQNKQKWCVSWETIFLCEIDIQAIIKKVKEKKRRLRDGS